MRTVLASLLILVLVGCSVPEAAASTERLEMRLSGWSALDIDVNRAGQGHYHLSHPFPQGRSGSFSIPPQQFTRLLARLQPFRAKAVPMSEQGARAFIEMRCPKGIPFTTDTGGVWVRWIGPGSDYHFLADLGCDPQRNAARNEELLSIIRSLPVPLKN